MEVLQFVPEELRDVLYDTCYANIDLDKAWLSWCGSAEEGLLQACRTAGGPMPKGDAHPFWDRRGGLGAVSPGCLHSPAMADEIDTTNCHNFINSSFAPVLVFGRRLHSVCDTPKGIRT